MKLPIVSRRCTAHRHGGQPCRAWAIRGGSVCKSHGGNAPQVRRKAAERIEEARDKSLHAYVEFVDRGVVDPKTTLDAIVKLTELCETLAGRVARREEVLSVQYNELSDAELEQAILTEAERITRRAAATPRSRD